MIVLTERKKQVDFTQSYWVESRKHTSALNQLYLIELVSAFSEG